MGARVPIYVLRPEDAAGVPAGVLEATDWPNNPGRLSDFVTARLAAARARRKRAQRSGVVRIDGIPTTKINDPKGAA